MRRRELLVGAGVTVGGLTDGEYGRVDNWTELDFSDGDESEPTDGTTETIEVGDPEAVAFPDAHPPHELEIHNAIGDPATVSIAIEPDRDDDAVEDDDAVMDDNDTVEDGDAAEDDVEEDDEDLEYEIELSDDDTLEVVFVEPRSYRVSIAVTDPEGGESTARERVDREPFDCLRSETSVTITETGLESESSSRTASCPEPTVTDHSLERGEQDCAGGGDEDEAAVAFTDETVVVEGAIRTPTPCHELEIESATYDADREVLEVTVAVGEQADGICVQCIGVVEYEARIDLDGRYPGHAEVVHDRGGETVEVESAAYEDAADRNR